MILSTVVIRQLVSRDEHIWLETIICLTVAQTRIVSMDVTMSRMKKKMFFFQTWKKMNYLHSQNLQVPLTLVGSLQFICVKQWMTHAFYVKLLKKHANTNMNEFNDHHIPTSTDYMICSYLQKTFDNIYQVTFSAS